MTSRLSNMVPTGVLAIVAVYWCWPYIAGESPGLLASPSEQRAETIAKVLAPLIGPVPERDPFQAAPSLVAEMLGDAASTASRDPSVPESAVSDPLDKMLLSVTVVGQVRRFAVINGQVVAEGELLDVGNATDSYRVKRIARGAVLIEHSGEVTELRFPDAFNTNVSGSKTPRADHG